MNKNYEIIVNKLKELLGEKELSPWVLPWKKIYGLSAARNYRSNHFYSGINRLLLNLIFLEEGYKYNFWLTFNQIKELGLNLSKGSKGVPILFYSSHIKTDEDGNENERFFIKRSTVFNLDQISDSEELTNIRDNLEIIKEEFVFDNSLKKLDSYLLNSGINIKHSNAYEASYSPKEDIIRLPLKKDFKSEDSLKATFFHELVHSTGHLSRLNRFKKGFNHQAYSKEELIAESGSFILQSICGVDSYYEEQQSASYIKSWSKYLKDDESLVIKAINKAMKAVDYIIYF